MAKARHYNRKPPLLCQQNPGATGGRGRKTGWKLDLVGLKTAPWKAGSGIGWWPQAAAILADLFLGGTIIGQIFPGQGLAFLDGGLIEGIDAHEFGDDDGFHLEQDNQLAQRVGIAL